MNKSQKLDLLDTMSENMNRLVAYCSDSIDKEKFSNEITRTAEIGSIAGTIAVLMEMMKMDVENNVS